MTLSTRTNERPCTVCERLYTVQSIGQRVCSPVCAGKSVKLAKKAERESIRARKDAIKTLPQLKALAQKAFNRFIRSRDYYKPCISCGSAPGRPVLGGAADAGHYRSVGSAPHLRFDEKNCHSQCKYCNRHLAGNHVAYRAGLLMRIGERHLDLLEADQCLRKYSREGLIELARHYNAEARILESHNAKSFCMQMVEVAL